MIVISLSDDSRCECGRLQGGGAGRGSGSEGRNGRYLGRRRLGAHLGKAFSESALRKLLFRARALPLLEALASAIDAATV